MTIMYLSKIRDQHGNNIYRHRISISDPICVRFNTLGYFKNNIKITELKNMNKYKCNSEMIRVKMLCNWCSSEQLCKE